MIREHFEIAETAVTVISEPEYIRIAKDAVFEARSQVERKIALDPYFKITYEPYPASKDDGYVVERMCNASLKASVGPMAAVAGAIAEYAVKKMAEAGAKYAVVDNGGDIALISDREVLIGMYADINNQRLSLKMPPADRIIGICSSSASVGPSVSFGRSDISTVISRDVSLADACATALGNMIKDNENMAEHLEKICGIDGVEGCLAYCGGSLGMCGNVPEIVGSRPKDEIITRIMF